MSLVRSRENDGTLRTASDREAAVHVVRRHETDAAMVVLDVVPAEEVDAESASVLDAAEAVGEIGPILQRLELRFGEWMSSET
jgi:hypothetical protein